MNPLDEAKKFSGRENQKVLESIHLLKEQCLDALESASSFSLEKAKGSRPGLGGIKNVVVAGMGGSALGAHIARSVLGDSLKVPVCIINNYELPGFVDEESLVILSSYSGGTEEVLSCFKKAKEKKAKMAVLTLGGELLELAKKNKVPACVYSARFNPSGAPRMGLGFAVFGIIGILSKLKLVDFGKAEIKKSATVLRKFADDFGANVPTDRNMAKKIALKLYEKNPIFVGSEFLTGNLHAIQNQVQETAKNFSVYFELPELNHHLMESLENPKRTKKDLFFLFFESNLYHKRTIKRYGITKEVIKKNGVGAVSYKLKSKDKISQVMEMIVFGSYLSFYLGALYGANPLKIQWVDYFKKRMK